MPVADMEAPDEPEPLDDEPELLLDDEPEELDEEEEPDEDELPELLLLALAAAAAALTAPASIEPSPIYFTPFPIRPMRWHITANCSRVSAHCGLLPSVTPAFCMAFHASSA